MKTKYIYIVTLIEDNGERIVFTTFDLKYAKKWCTKANKMIDKWQFYWEELYYDAHNYNAHYTHRDNQWQEVRKAVIVKTELR